MGVFTQGRLDKKLKCNSLRYNKFISIKFALTSTLIFNNSSTNKKLHKDALTKRGNSKYQSYTNCQNPICLPKYNQANYN